MAKTGRKSGSILVVFLLELISLVGLAVLAYFLRFTENFAVIKQDYSCGTFTLSKEGPPFKDSIVFSGLKATEYYLIFGLGPVLMIFLSEIARSIIIYSLSHDSSSNTVHQKALGIPFPLFIRRIVRIIAGFLFGLLLTTILVDVIKVQTGALRPYFGTFCKNLTEHCKSSPETLNATQVDDLCKGISSEDMREARLSFPSVSGALAAYSATFMILYLAFALPYRALRFIRLWITLGLVAIVFFTVNAGLSTFQHHSEDMIVGLIIGLLFALYAVFIHLNAFANRLSVSNPLSAKRAGEENVGNKKNIEGGPLSSSPFSDPFDETGSLSNRGSGSAGGLFGGGNSGGGGENDKDWFWKNFHIPRVRQSARNMWRRSENYFSGRGRGGNRNVTNTSPRTSGLHPTTTTATTNLSRHTSNAYINPAFNGGGSRLNDDHILANHLHQETRFGGNGGNGNGNGNGNGALGASSTANLHHPGANHRASSTLRTFQASSNA